MEISGKIKLINDLQTFDSGFTKREFVITTEGEYPQDIKFTTVKDKTSMLNDYAIGDDVTVSMNIRGNEYEGKYYVDLHAWKITKG